MASKQKYPEFKRLSEFLKKEGVAETTKISFRELSDADNRYALLVESRDKELVRKLAAYFGCPEEDLPNALTDDCFEASDSWHGGENGDLRELGDEFGLWDQPFFDRELTVAGIHQITQ